MQRVWICSLLWLELREEVVMAQSVGAVALDIVSTSYLFKYPEALVITIA